MLKLKSKLINQEDIIDGSLREDFFDDEFDDEFFDTEEEYDDLDIEEKSKEKKEDEIVNRPSYDIIYNNKVDKDNSEPLSKVIGHINQKKEILSVIDWFNRSKELKSRGVSIPKGVILFGNPGNGKSLLIKEIIRCVDAPVFVFRGEKANIVSGIIDMFNKAKETGHAIVVIDELDLLINDDARLIRALQECLDGVEENDDILVLSATNSIRRIPGALTRNGRLEKLIRIPYPTGEEAFELLKKHFKEFGVELPKNIDVDEIELSLGGITCAGVKAVVNDIVLRNGFENITVKMIDESIYNITEKIKDAIPENNLEVAIHEAGHAIMAKRFEKYFKVNQLKISGASGMFTAKEIEEDFWPYDKVIADIKIAMAGILAQKLICNRGSRGCDEDLQHARRCAYNLFNICGYSSCWETLPLVEQGNRCETMVKRRKMEIKIEKLLKKCEKDSIRYLKKHIDEIKRLGNLLFEKKNLKSSEILSIVG